MIMPKLFARLTDMLEEVKLSEEKGNIEEASRLNDEMLKFEEEVGWPWKASWEQLEKWGDISQT